MSFTDQELVALAQAETLFGVAGQTVRDARKLLRRIRDVNPFPLTMVHDLEKAAEACWKARTEEVRAKESDSVDD